MYKAGDSNHDDLMFEFRLDYENIQDQLVRCRSSKQIRSLRRANARFPQSFSFDFRTDRGNRYIAVYTFSNRNEVFCKHFTECLVAIVTIPDGRYKSYTFGIGGDDGMAFICEMAPHAYEQYADRMNLNVRGISLMKEFHRRNRFFVPAHDFERPGEENAIMYTCNDGAVFGRAENGIVRFFTFIASNTMQHGYKSQFDKKHNERTIEETEKSVFPEYLKRKVKLREK